jgi:alpha-1,2-mannosyltransferase
VRLELAVFVIALAVRVSVVLRSGGFNGNYGYDAGVYYSAAAALIHGRVPYRDFVLLHPPGIMLALSPAAWVGRITTDHIGFASANLGFSTIGAVNAALVVLVARRLGLGVRSAAVGGLFYALWFGSAGAEFLARLEPLGNLFLLVGLAVVLTARGRQDWLLAVGGAALGVASSVKIWFAVPLVIVAIWVAIERRSTRPVVMYLVGGLVALLVVDGPFLLFSRGQMWSMVITDQLHRPRSAVPLLSRLADLGAVHRLARQVSHGPLLALVVAIICLFVIVLVFAWRVRVARLIVVLALAQIAVLIAAPSWFGFYADYAAVPVSLCLAAAAGALPHRLRMAAWIPTAAAAAVTVVIVAVGSFHAVAQLRGTGRLIAKVAHLRCVMSDAPSGLIELNVLDRDLSNGCRNWVDVTGRTYFGADRARLARTHDSAWQRDLQSYLSSGDAAILVRAQGTGIAESTLRSVQSGGVLARAGGQTVYRTRGTGPPYSTVFSVSSARNQQGLAYAHAIFYIGYDVGGGNGEIVEYSRVGKRLKSSGPLPIGHTAELGYRRADGDIYAATGGATNPTFVNVIDMRPAKPKIVRRYDFTALGSNGMVAIDNAADRMVVFAGPSGGPYTIALADFHGRVVTRFAVPDEGVPQGLEVIGHRIVLLASASDGTSNKIVALSDTGTIHRQSVIGMATETEGLTAGPQTGTLYFGTRNHAVDRIPWSVLIRG